MERQMYTDTPLPLLSTPAFKTGKTDPFTKEGSHMALSHNSFIRGFNSIYQQAPRVGISAIKDFIAYCLAWQQTIYLHHHYEETGLFPAFEKASGQKGIMDGEVAEHAVFHDGLSAFKTYLDSLEKRESDFKAAELLAIMDSFSKPLHAHLASEPDAIVALSRFSTPENPIDIEKIVGEMGRKQVTLSYTMNHMPMFLLNMETVEFEGGMWHGVFPPIPRPINYVLKSLVPMWKSSQWRYASCDENGARKRLAV